MSGIPIARSRHSNGPSLRICSGRYVLSSVAGAPVFGIEDLKYSTEKACEVYEHAQTVIYSLEVGIV